MNKTKKQIDAEDEKQLRRWAWDKLSRNNDYETLVYILTEAYELGVKHGHAEGYLEGLKKGLSREKRRIVKLT